MTVHGASTGTAVADYHGLVHQDVSVISAKARYTLDELASRARPVLDRVGAERAVAFGSYARGSADGFSDLDLVVVLPTDLPPADRPRLLAGLHEAIPVPLDLLVYTPDEYARGVAQQMHVFDAIVREGVTIFERRKS